MRKYDILISDVDGVILNRMPIYREIFVEICRRKGISSEKSVRYYYATAGTVLGLQFSGILDQEKIPSNHHEIEEMCAEFYKKARKRKAPLFDNADIVTNGLHESGVKLFATSGSQTDELRRLFAGYGLPYDFVLGSDELEKGTLHLRRFAEVIGEEFKSFCERAVYVGDGPFDMRTAMKHDIFGVGITTTVSAQELERHGAREIINNIGDIRRFFK